MEEKKEKKPAEPEAQDSSLQDGDLDGVAGGGAPEIMAYTGEKDPLDQY